MVRSSFFGVNMPSLMVLPNGDFLKQMGSMHHASSALKPMVTWGSLILRNPHMYPYVPTHNHIFYSHCSPIDYPIVFPLRDGEIPISHHLAMEFHWSSIFHDIHIHISKSIPMISKQWMVAKSCTILDR